MLKKLMANTFNITMGSFDMQIGRMLPPFLKPQRKFGYNTGLLRDHCLVITDTTTRATKNKNINLLLIQRQRA